MSVDFLYFDLGVVILDFDHEIGCRRVSEMAGISPDAAKQAIFDSGLQVRYETGLVTSAEFHQTFCEIAKCSIGQDDLLTAISDIFTPNQSVVAILTQLRSSGYPMGILSNTCEAHWQLVYQKHAILQKFFEPIILSYEANSMKPDSRIYEVALEQAGCQSRKVFFVDDRQENVDGAIKAGLDAVLYTSGQQLIKDLESRGVHANY